MLGEHASIEDTYKKIVNPLKLISKEIYHSFCLIGFSVKD